MSENKTALLIVDVQKDFLPGGALGVENGDRVVEPLLRHAPDVDLIVASRDWHPAGHCSFQAQGGPWPEHCLANEPGSELVPEVEKAADMLINKGTELDKDAYSAFDETGLAGMLREQGVGNLLVGGLATDVCVKATVLDALAEGFQVTLIKEGCAAVNLEPDDDLKAIQAMFAAGATIQ